MALRQLSAVGAYDVAAPTRQVAPALAKQVTPMHWAPALRQWLPSWPPRLQPPWSTPLRAPRRLARRQPSPPHIPFSARTEPNYLQLFGKFLGVPVAALSGVAAPGRSPFPPSNRELTLPRSIRCSVINQRRLKTVPPSPSPASTWSSSSVRCLFSPVYDTAVSNVQRASVAVVAGASH